MYTHTRLHRRFSTSSSNTSSTITTLPSAALVTHLSLPRFALSGTRKKNSCQVQKTHTSTVTAQARKRMGMKRRLAQTAKAPSMNTTARVP